MRITFEPNPLGDNTDYLEILISRKQMAELEEQGLAREYNESFRSENELSVFIRVDPQYKEGQDAVEKREE